MGALITFVDEDVRFISKSIWALKSNAEKVQSQGITFEESALNSVKIFATQNGKKAIIENYFNQKSPIDAMCAEFGWSNVKFSIDDIIEISGLEKFDDSKDCELVCSYIARELNKMNLLEPKENFYVAYSEKHKSLGYSLGLLCNIFGSASDVLCYVRESDDFSKTAFYPSKTDKKDSITLQVLPKINLGKNDKFLNSDKASDFSFNQKYVNNLCSKFDLKDFDVKLVLNKTDLFLVGKSFNIQIYLNATQFMVYKFIASFGKGEGFDKPSVTNNQQEPDENSVIVGTKAVFKSYLDMFKHVPLWGKEAEEFKKFALEQEDYIRRLPDELPKHYFEGVDKYHYFLYIVYDKAYCCFETLTNRVNKKDDNDIENKFGQTADSDKKDFFFTPKKFYWANYNFSSFLDQQKKEINQAIKKDIQKAIDKGIINSNYVSDEDIKALVKKLQIKGDTGNRKTIWYIPYVYEGNSISVVQSL